jgi:WD40 repeat protein
VGHGGGLSLWNIRSGRKLHEFTAVTAAVTALEPSPALDVVAVGMSDGRIVLLNLKFDRAIFEFKQERVAVTALSFRTDASALDTPMLASGAADGQVCLAMTVQSVTVQGAQSVTWWGIQKLLIHSGKTTIFPSRRLSRHAHARLGGRGWRCVGSC